MARYHGAIHLAYAQGEATRLTDETIRLKAWLDDLRRAAPAEIEAHPSSEA